jgi:uncharacterized glyoxalase superfamily protein PhnB
MPLDLYMLGLIVQDMHKGLEFYRRLGLAIPDVSNQQTHVEVKMGGGLTFFLDSQPSRWDPNVGHPVAPAHQDAAGSAPVVLEFYLKERSAVDAKYQELVDLGYQSYCAPYATSFGMYFAMIKDPDGHTILLSGDLDAHQLAEAAETNQDHPTPIRCS